MSIEVICGPMFSGKTEELIRRIIRAKYAKQRIYSFKPVIDTRYSMRHISSHSGIEEPCILINTPDDVVSEAKKDSPDLVAIEEAQFLDYEKFVKMLKFLRDRSIKTIVAGLDMDFMGNPFENLVYSMGLATKVNKLTAICVNCSSDATMTYKKHINTQRVEIGKAELYEARCYDCWKQRI